MKRFVASLYLVAGLASAFICLQSLMWAVWGAPTHWTQYVGLISSLAVAVGAFGLLISGVKGQVTCAVGVAGMGFFYIPAVQSVIPAENIIISPINYVILAGYLALVAGVMMYPKRLKGAAGVVGFVVFAMGAWVATTAYSRSKSGEFNRPQLVGFLASRSAEPLTVSEEYTQLISITVRARIANEGIGGLLRFSGSSGEDGRQTKMVVIASTRINAPQELRYPKQGIIVYVWNGERWPSFPKDAECYSAHATLQVDGMISNELVTGGVQSSLFFPWQKP